MIRPAVGSSSRRCLRCAPAGRGEHEQLDLLREASSAAAQPAGCAPTAAAVRQAMSPAGPCLSSSSSRAVIVERLSRPDARDLIDDRKHPDIDELRTEALALRARLDALAVDFADGSLTASQLRAATGRVRAKLADVEATRADAGRLDVLGPLVSADDVHAVWDSLSAARRCGVIDVLATVTICPPGRGVRTFDPDTVRIDWRQQ